MSPSLSVWYRTTFYNWVRLNSSFPSFILLSWPKSLFNPNELFGQPNTTGGSLSFWKMFNSNRDSLINSNVLCFSQIPVCGHGQELFRRKVAPPGPPLSVQFQPVNTKVLHGSSEPQLLLDHGKGQYCLWWASLKNWDSDPPFSY